MPCSRHFLQVAWGIVQDTPELKAEVRASTASRASSKPWLQISCWHRLEARAETYEALGLPPPTSGVHRFACTSYAHTSTCRTSRAP